MLDYGNAVTTHSRQFQGVTVSLSSNGSLVSQFVNAFTADHHMPTEATPQCLPDQPIDIYMRGVKVLGLN